VPNPPDSVTVRVPGKINLYLAVGPLREDGYHELTNLFHAVDVYDELVASSAGTLSVSVEAAGGPLLDVPADARNTAWHAAELLARANGLSAAVQLAIRKRIPVSGGMAGGSADAAAALVACARLWQLSDVRVHLADHAATIGSDVAFPLVGGTAIGTSRGEVLAPVPTVGVLHWVLVLADYGISAGAAYAEFDRLQQATRPAPAVDSLAELLAALARNDVPAVAAALRNDLQAAAVSLAPSLAATLTAGREAGALAAIVSGSGPTVALLCADAAAAGVVAAALDRQGLRVLTACGPVPGVEVLG
jgi:4-diphosphocytidyl-2-C-methyl-D-erythritol kinase